MKKVLLFISSSAMVLLLSSCGYDGHFRYPCQDPANWESEDCKPPVCTINGACPEDLVDLDQLEDSSSQEVTEKETAQDGETTNE